jgi:hypothetical protein
VWGLRTALTLAVALVTASALGGLFHREIAPHDVLALLLLALAAGTFAWPRTFDVFGISAVALRLNTSLVAGLARLCSTGTAAGARRHRWL